MFCTLFKIRTVFAAKCGVIETLFFPQGDATHPKAPTKDLATASGCSALLPRPKNKERKKLTQKKISISHSVIALNEWAMLLNAKNSPCLSFLITELTVGIYKFYSL